MEEEFENNETAEIHYKKCLTIDDTYSAAYHNYAVLLHKSNRLEMAQTNYTKALDLNCQYMLTHRNYALLSISLHDHSTAYYHLTLA